VCVCACARVCLCVCVCFVYVFACERRLSGLLGIGVFEEKEELDVSA